MLIDFVKLFKNKIIKNDSQLKRKRAYDISKVDLIEKYYEPIVEAFLDDLVTQDLENFKEDLTDNSRLIPNHKISMIMIPIQFTDGISFKFSSIKTFPRTIETIKKIENTIGDMIHHVEAIKAHDITKHKQIFIRRTVVVKGIGCLDILIEAVIASDTNIHYVHLCICEPEYPLVW